MTVVFSDFPHFFVQRFYFYSRFLSNFDQFVWMPLRVFKHFASRIHHLLWQLIKFLFPSCALCVASLLDFCGVSFSFFQHGFLFVSEGLLHLLVLLLELVSFRTELRGNRGFFLRHANDLGIFWRKEIYWLEMLAERAKGCLEKHLSRAALSVRADQNNQVECHR